MARTCSRSSDAASPWSLFAERVDTKHPAVSEVVLMPRDVPYTSSLSQRAADDRRVGQGVVRADTISRDGSRALDNVGTPRGRPSVRKVAVGIIAWVVLGAIAGFITNLLMGGGEGVIATVILGIVGAVVGGFLMGTVLNLADVTGINISSIVVAVIGAIVVVAVYRLVVSRRTTT
jgi:uncharacterized membrane protein YeaQ/YmgE (transglycosylase-associated protein family)